VHLRYLLRLPDSRLILTFIRDFYKPHEFSAIFRSWKIYTLSPLQLIKSLPIPVGTG
jgi:hypothetical protein